MARAGAVTAAGITLILPGQTNAGQKSYKKLASANIQTGDLVICARLSGTYVVLGKIV